MHPDQRTIVAARGCLLEVLEADRHQLGSSSQRVAAHEHQRHVAQIAGAIAHVRADGDGVAVSQAGGLPLVGAHRLGDALEREPHQLVGAGVGQASRHVHA